MSIFSSTQIAALSDFYSKLLSSFGVSCKLFYQPTFVQTNLNPQLADSTYLSNIGPHGGPMTGISPETGDTSLKTQQITETINLIIDWQIKDNRLYAENTKVPYGIIRTHGLLTDYPKIQRCIEMQANLPEQPIVVGRYRLFGDGGDVFSIVQGKYFICYWERIS